MKKRSLMDRLRDKKQQKSQAVAGVCWYLEPDWLRIKAAAQDPEGFEDSFSEWEAMANESFATIRGHWPNALKVLVSADEFLPWCLVHGKINNAATRAEYTGAKVRGETGYPAA